MVLLSFFIMKRIHWFISVECQHLDCLFFLELRVRSILVVGGPQMMYLLFSTNLLICSTNSQDLMKDGLHSLKGIFNH